MKKLLSLVFILSFWSSAHAHERHSHCTLDGTVSGIGLSVIFGGQILKGEGLVTCVNGSRVETLPVRLSFVSGGWGFDLTYVRAMRVVAVYENPHNGVNCFTGRYALGVTAGATLIAAGIQADAALSATTEDGGAAFEVGLLGRDAIGLGVRLQGTFLKVRPMYY